MINGLGGSSARLFCSLRRTGSVSGTDLFGVVDKFESKSDQRKFAHGSTKSAGVFNDVKALLQSAATNAVGTKVNSIENEVEFIFIRDNRN